MSNLKEDLSAKTAQWKTEKDCIETIRSIQSKIDEARRQEEIAERQGQLDKVAEIRYGTLNELQKQLAGQNARLADIQKNGSFLSEEVTEEHVSKIVSSWTGIPVDRLMESEMQKLISLEKEIGQRVIGQSDGIKAVSEAVRRARAGLKEPDRPIGSFIFLGPTGVGKTELARALAESMFDDENAMVRIDMSEYMEKHAVSRLIGAPPGYVGYEEGGQLTEAVRRRPYSVILLDEIEKAHPDVFNILLQLLDDGRLTDNQGRTVDFRNTVVIMTSNIGSTVFNESDNTDAEKSDAVRALLRAHFRPEFLNRIDETVVFHPLSRDNIRAIVDVQLKRLAERLESRRLTLDLDDAAKELLAERGFDPAYGARPLKRAIQQYLLDPVAYKIIAGDIKEGDHILVRVDSGELSFQAVPQEKADS